MEAKLQRKIIIWLKQQGAYVIKTKPGPGTPVGCPDIIALYEKKWLAIEVKSTSKSPFRPGQQATLRWLKNGNEYVYVADPDNWEIMKQTLSISFF